MSIALAVIAVVVTFLAGYFMVKGYKPAIVLLLAGFFLVTISALLNSSLVLVDPEESSGLKLFDIVGMFESIAGSQLTGVGLIIMTAGGFSAYMNKIGASRALVEVVSKPVAKIRNPYLLLILAYFLGQALFMVIPSAAGLAILLVVLLLPVLTAAGVSPAAAGAVIATSSGLPMGPAMGTTVLAADTVGQSPAVYFVQNQLLVAIPTMIAIAITHHFTQRHFDKKSKGTLTETEDSSNGPAKAAPHGYALFLALPIILLIVFSPIVNDSIELSTVSAFLLVWLLALITELIRRRSGKQVLNESAEFFKGMGNMFASVVSLIIAAQLFAQGLKATGLIDMMINGAQNLGYGMIVMVIVFTLIVGLVTFLTGSGVGAFSAFAKLAPDVAKGFDAPATQLVTPMQFASGMFRAMSPVSGVVITVSGAVGISPFELVKRTAPPMLIGALIMTICSLILL